MIQIRLNMRGVSETRPRVTKFGTYNAPKYDSYKRSLQYKMRGFNRLPNVPLRMEIFFGFTPAKNADKSKYPVPKHNVDDLAKGVLDACNGILFEDDVLIEELIVTKRYVDKDVVLITIKEIE